MLYLHWSSDLVGWVGESTCNWELVYNYNIPCLFPYTLLEKEVPSTTGFLSLG